MELIRKNMDLMKMWRASPTEKAQFRLNEYLRRQLGHFYRVPALGPVGPRNLIAGTAVLNEEDLNIKSFEETYFSSGLWQIHHWLKILEKSGFNLRTATAVLELGCGSGRLIRHLRGIEGLSLVGTDLLEANVNWCRENITGADFYQNQLVPPLEFAAANSFDLVYAASVFTHIPIDYRDLWIAEIARILQPGGFLVCDVIGPFLQEKMLKPAQLDEMRQKGHFTLDAGDEEASYSTKVIDSWDVFMTKSEVLKAFRKHFEVVDYLPEDLDLLILKRNN